MDFQKIIGKLKELEQPAQQKEIVSESVVMEKKLTKAETKKKEEVVKSMKKGKGDFEKRYGKDKGEQVMYATATKIAKKKAESVEALDTDEEIAEVFDADAKVGDKKKTAKGVATKTATGLKHERSYKDDADDNDKPAKAKKVKEAAKPDFLDMDKDGDKKEPMKKAVADKKKGAVKEEEEKRAPAKKQEREITLPSGAKAKATKVQGWQSQKADKEAAKSKNESAKPAKKAIKESVEPKLSFKDCIRLVRESGGQQQIDPLDKALWQWAQRVAQSKFTESVKQDAFAGITYERFGGRFALYDVLSETKK